MMFKTTTVVRQKTLWFLKGLLRSYSQVFFSDHLVFSALLLMLTFIDWHTGVAGLLSVVVSHSLALMLGLNHTQVEKGSYGFNALLTGLGLAFFFGPSPVFFLVLVVGAVLSLFISVMLQGLLGKYGLPFLSLPFIFALWMLNLGSVDFSYLGLSERGVFSLNHLFGLGGKRLVDLVLWWNDWTLPSAITTYFKSLAAILFMQDVLPGVIVAVGLLLYSRMALSLSLLGFVTALFFYQIIGADFSSLNYSYIGFNYILTSIALGGFFLVPSWRSYLISLLIIPLVATFSIGFSRLLATWYLPVYALPFNLSVLMVLYVLKMREKPSNKLSEVYIQHNSPEKNFYAVHNFNQRFGNKREVSIGLPFFGAWTVNQGHAGDITHRGEWQYAWDFVITGDDGKEYINDGGLLTDYYCYDKQVVAPAAGVVEQVIENVADNVIGETNLVQNWGNTIVVKVDEFLYYKLSHLKPNSVVVKTGDPVKEGQVLARCGNTGRSPYPHLHFQIQETPYVGSPTTRYAICNYLVNSEGGRQLVTYDFPGLGETVENIYPLSLLRNALQFKPGQRLTWTGNGDEVVWEVKTTIYNETYLECQKTGAKAWFECGGAVFWFTHFEGPRRTLLYLFYLGLYKVPLTFEAGLQVTDTYPVNLVFSKINRWGQDFVAPFRVLLRATYQMQFRKIDDPTFPTHLTFESTTYRGRMQLKKIGNFAVEINTKGIQSFHYQWKNGEKQEVVCSY